MTAEYFLINNRSNGQAVETVGERLPEFNIVSAFAFIVESVYPIDTGALVITTQQEKILWVLDLVRQ